MLEEIKNSQIINKIHDWVCEDELQQIEELEQEVVRLNTLLQNLHQNLQIITKKYLDLKKATNSPWS